MQGKVRGSDVSSLEQFFTEDMVNGLLKRCHADGTGHALSLHGPDAQIMDRLQNDNVNMASKFNNSKEMLNATHESITKGNLTQTRGVNKSVSQWLHITPRLHSLACDYTHAQTPTD